MIRKVSSVFSKVFWEINLLLLFINGNKKGWKDMQMQRKKEHGYREREQAVV